MISVTAVAPRPLWHDIYTKIIDHSSSCVVYVKVVSVRRNFNYQSLQACMMLSPRHLRKSLFLQEHNR